MHCPALRSLPHAIPASCAATAAGWRVYAPRAIGIGAAVFAALAPVPAAAEPMPPVLGMLDAQASDGDPFVDDEIDVAAPKHKPARDVNQVRFELGMGGPSGLLGVRYSRVLSTGTRLEPGVGLGYTGVLGSMMISHPLVERTRYTLGRAPVSGTFELYGGYSASLLGDGLRHSWVGREAFIPDGTYHWLDLGISTQIRWRGARVTTGLGVTKLLSGPSGIGGEDLEDETFWFAFPEGWIGKQGIAPSLWSSVGWAF